MQVSCFLWWQLGFFFFFFTISSEKLCVTGAIKFTKMSKENGKHKVALFALVDGCD